MKRVGAGGKICRAAGLVGSRILAGMAVPRTAGFAAICRVQAGKEFIGTTLGFIAGILIIVPDTPLLGAAERILASTQVGGAAATPAAAAVHPLATGPETVIFTFTGFQVIGTTGW